MKLDYITVLCGIGKTRGVSVKRVDNATKRKRYFPAIAYRSLVDGKERSRCLRKKVKNSSRAVEYANMVNKRLFGLSKANISKSVVTAEAQ